MKNKVEDNTYFDSNKGINFLSLVAKWYRWDAFRKHLKCYDRREGHYQGNRGPVEPAF